MKKIKCLILGLLFCIATVYSYAESNFQISEVPFTQVHFFDQFLAPRIETIRTVTIPYAFKRSEEAGYIDNFAIAGGLKEGKYQSHFTFDDAEVFKILEGASYLLSVKKDPELEAYLDNLIDIIASAQEEDGYLFTNRTINDPLHPWAGPERWLLDWDLSHETFNMGELYECAVAYYYATGKRKLLDVAIKNADLVCSVFNEDGLCIAPGHEVIEMALVRLYLATGDEKYLKESRYFLESRGKKEFDKNSKDLRQNGQYWQNHLPVTQQDEAVGHAVRALYLYSGMADIAAYMHDEAYLKAIDKIWENIVSKKFYITGGLGATAHNEAFGENYYLPNATAYCETCAAIANCMFNLRMFKLHGESKYFDVLERSLYNNVFDGISVSGDRFFYPNVLEVNKNGNERSLWFDCSCCPTNLSRFIPAIPGYVYATDKESIYANLFAGSSSEIVFNGKKIKLEQQTNYPWNEEVSFIVDPVEINTFNLKIRIPGWATGHPVPSDLYAYSNSNKGSVKITVNGKPYNFSTEKGYAVIKKQWEKGDKVSVSFPMETRTVVSNKAVTSNEGLIAIERGPIVYCAEFADNNGTVSDLSIPENATFKTVAWPDFVNGIYKIEATGKKYFISQDGKQVKEENAIVTLIPYYARSYRGNGDMKVWMPKDGTAIKQALEDKLRTVDEVIVGNEQSEKDHNLQGERTRTDRGMGWRDADNGWFSYDLKVQSDKPQELVLTYHSTDGGNRSFEIWIDDKMIAQHTLRTETFDALIDTSYPIPQSLIKGKNKVTVKLKALPDNFAGGIFGCKILITK